MTYEEIGEKKALTEAMPFAAGLVKMAGSIELRDGQEYCYPLMLSKNKLLKHMYDTVPALIDKKQRYKTLTGQELDGIDYAFPCVSDEEEKKRIAFEQKQKAAHIERLRRQCFAYPIMYKYIFAADDNRNPELSEMAKEYVYYFDSTMKPEGIGALMYGGVGTGKTFMACCIANALVERGKRCKFTSFAETVTELEDFSKKQTVLKSLTEYDMVVIDDLGTERRSSYMAEQVFAIIDALYKSNTPMIVTTNLTITDMSDKTDITRHRVYDRIKERCAVLMEFKGKSRRGEIGASNMRDLQAVAGGAVQRK